MVVIVLNSNGVELHCILMTAEYHHLSRLKCIFTHLLVLMLKKISLLPCIIMSTLAMFPWSCHGFAWCHAPPPPKKKEKRPKYTSTSKITKQWKNVEVKNTYILLALWGSHCYTKQLNVEDMFNCGVIKGSRRKCIMWHPAEHISWKLHAACRKNMEVTRKPSTLKTYIWTTVIGLKFHGGMKYHTEMKVLFFFFF